jgi:DNA polymerase-1
MQHANKPNRIALVAAAVDAGRTSDEERKNATESNQQKNGPNGQRWLLAVDVNYFLHRFWFSGAGVESAVGVAGWIARTVERLRDKGLTDIACCLDSKTNHRKELTAGWEDKYKDRPQKDPELVQQLQLVHELLVGKGFACISLDGMEADDCMASFAKQFPGRVTLLTQDKDCRQCLSDKCNMLLDVEWIEDPTSGDMLPEYKWLSAKKHTEATGIPPEKWVEYQIIMGDATDGIKGCAGIGEKGAADLVKQFGTVAAVIQAAKDDDPRIKQKKREALIEFEGKHEITRQLVTLRTDLQLPTTTKI